LQSIYYILWRFAWQEQILKKNAGAIPRHGVCGSGILCDTEKQSLKRIDKTGPEYLL
jgi:hypothetical protein